MLQRTLTACLLLLCLEAPAPAQLLMSALDGSPQVGGKAISAWYVDGATGQSIALWRDLPLPFGVNDAGGVVWIPSGTDLLEWTYAAQGEPALHGSLGAAPGGQYIEFDGVCFAQNKLWGVSTPSGGPNLGVYEIVIADAGQPSFAHLRKNLGLSLQGLAYDPTTALFYAARSGIDATAGLYSVNVLGAGQPVKIAPLPAGVTQVRGVGSNGGKLYLTPAGAGQIHVFDLASGQYDPNPLPSPSTDITNYNRGGAGWAANLVPLALAPAKFCVANPSASGCAPSINFTGLPSASATSGFLISATSVAFQKNGTLLYQIGGPRSIVPFNGGPICFGPNGIKRTLAMNSGGTQGAPCSGSFSMDFSAFAAGALGGQPDPALRIPGTLVYSRFWARDLPIPGAVQLSDALEYGVRP